NPIFHASFMYMTFDADCNKDCTEIVENLIKDFDFNLKEDKNILINRLKIKCGNKYHFFKFE
ncbi:hypothetical protein BpHYR1_010325, partial [Brachionus plicatilis]